MQKRKGQAAMEFLMTYGWAILVVLIAIGALAYFGVLNPGNFLPRTCTLMPGLDCSEFKVDKSDSQVQLLVRNGLGESIDFSSINLDVNLDGTADCTAIDPASIPDGGISPQLNIADCTIGAAGDRFRGNIIGVYTLGSGTLAHSMQGNIVSEVEA